MARIPQIESSQRLTAQAPTARKQRVDGIGEELAGFGEALAKGSEVLLRARIFTENTRAGNDLSKRIAEIELDAEREPEIYSPEKYTERLKQAQQESAKINSLPAARNRFILESENTVLASSLGITKLFRKKQIDAGKAEVISRGGILGQEYARVPQNVRPMKTTQLNMLYANAVKNGFLTREEASKNIKATLENWQKELIDVAIETDPEYALEQIRLGEKGEYADVPSSMRLEKEKTARARISSNAKIAEEARQISFNEEENKMTQGILEGSIAERDIDKAEFRGEAGLQGGISKGYAASARKMLNSPKTAKPNGLEKVVKYNELVERNAQISKKESAWLGLGKASFDEIAKYRADVFDASSKNLITDSEMKLLLGDTAKTFYRDPIFAQALGALAAQSKLYATPEAQALVKGEMYSNLIQKVIEGKKPQEAVVEVIKEKLSGDIGKAMEAGGSPGRIYATKGSQRIYSEDEGETWYDEKTGEVVE